MANHKRPGEKASETVTFRLTVDERALLDHLAQADGVTLTDLFRSLIAARAAEAGIEEPPPPMPRRRPGRPRKRVATAPGLDAPAKPSLETPVSPVSQERPPAVPSFGDLLRRFESGFADRSESTRAEFNATIAWLTDAADGEPLVARSTPLTAIGSARLLRIRDRLKDLELRVAQKNLHLTYLRMLFAFAVKEPDMPLDFDPDAELAPLTAKEIGATWSVPPPAPEEDR
jgi:hypothetical protein